MAFIPKFISTPVTIPSGDKMFTPEQLSTLDKRLSANAEKVIAKRRRSAPAQLPAKPTSGRGRPPQSIPNPFAGYIGPATYWGRYPVFAMDIVEGIARLDWENKTTNIGEKTTPLSVLYIMRILETLESVTTDSVMELLGLKKRHAQRYVKAVKLALPYMMKSRPRRLVEEMEADTMEPLNDQNELTPYIVEMDTLDQRDELTPYIIEIETLAA